MPINASHVQEKSTFYINYRQPYASVTPLSAFSCSPSVKETMTCWTYESEPLCFFLLLMPYMYVHLNVDICCVTARSVVFRHKRRLKSQTNY